MYMNEACFGHIMPSKSIGVGCNRPKYLAFQNHLISRQIFDSAINGAYHYLTSSPHYLLKRRLHRDRKIIGKILV